MTVSITVPTTEPSELVAGTTWTWKKTISEFLPSDGWVLSYALVISNALIEITASDDDDDHLVEIAGATTAAYAAGEYDWQSYVENSGTGERYRHETGKLKVLPDFAEQVTGYDARSYAKKTMDAIDEYLAGKEDRASYTINGRSLSAFSYADLIAARDYFAARYITEERKAGRVTGSKIRTRFNRIM